jgi:hypothetical protein
VIHMMQQEDLTPREDTGRGAMKWRGGTHQSRNKGSSPRYLQQGNDTRR